MTDLDLLYRLFVFHSVRSHIFVSHVEKILITLVSERRITEKDKLEITQRVKSGAPLNFEGFVDLMSDKEVAESAM